MTSSKHQSAEEKPNIRQAAEGFVARGWRTVRLRPGGKVPYSAAWQNADPKSEEFETTDNVGVQLGGKSGHLIDIDLDSPEARALAGLECFFGAAVSFRRASLSEDEPGHRLVVCSDAPDCVERFGFSRAPEKAAVASLRLPKSVIVELRAGRGFTVFPPSIIGDDPLVWGPGDREPLSLDWQTLRQRAGLLAFAAFAAACYPSEGSRDDFCLHLAGTLIHLGVEVETAEEIVTAIARLKNDTENREGKPRAAAAKKQANEQVTGLPTFLEFVGMQACEKRIRLWLSLAAVDDATDRLPRNAIDVGNIDHAARANEIEAMLINKRIGIFRHGPELVRVRKLDNPQGSREQGTWRHEGLIELTPANAEWIAIQASSFGVFYKRTARGKLIRVAPTAEIMKQLQITIDERKFPSVIGLAMTPILTRDEPGYDASSRLFLAFEADAFPKGPIRPTREDAEAALERLRRPLRGFPFVDQGALSVALSGMLSAVIRGQLRTCPLHAFDAPAAGSGKTKLCEVIGVLATGVPPSGISHSASDEENDKRLVALFRAGDPVILIDNVTGDLEGNALCTALTQETIQARVLGLSEVVRLSTRSLVLATGNNLRLNGDLTRRAVVCRLDAKMANPEERRFDFDPVAEVRQSRASLVVDALTVLRAFIDAGKPVVLSPFGSFEDWTLVRGALVWLGCADPFDTKEALKAENPELEERGELVRALLRTFKPGVRFTVSQISAMSEDSSSVRSALARLLRDGRWDSKRAGQLLRKHKDVPFHGVTLRSRRTTVKVQEYFLEGDPDQALQDEVRTM